MALSGGEVADREAGMGMGAAHHEGVGRAGRQVVVRVAAGAGDEARVLDAAHGLADAEFLRGHLVHGGSLSAKGGVRLVGG